jgi:hypothetical protein
MSGFDERDWPLQAGVLFDANVALPEAQRRFKRAEAEIVRLRCALNDIDDYLTNAQTGDIQPGEMCKQQARFIARDTLGLP